MRWLLPLSAISTRDQRLVGGKAVALANLADHGLQVPPTLCVTTESYEAFVQHAGLRAVIHQELGRKDFSAMRWEEIWDAALRIRNRFLRAPLPAAVRDEIVAAVAGDLADRALVVRSSAPGEDSGATSFAGLHESIVDVRGAESVVDAVRRVWASLWSDRALLYRQELRLDVDSSSMAVLLQELIDGRCSGVAFGTHPSDPGLAAIEAVYGLNQGLVDGSVEPDHWDLDRASWRPVAHRPPPTRFRTVSVAGSPRVEEVPPPNGEEPPLDAAGLERVADALRRIESLFGAPQDMEWTMPDRELVVLQARPVTTGPTGDGDQRAWYLSLTRSLDNLRRLRTRVENDLIPALDREAEELARVEIDGLDDEALAHEIGRRRAAHDRWVDVYWQEFIPLAHGIRLFGQFYNDLMHPDDPYEFMDLLTSTAMLSTSRNQELARLAAQLARDPELRARLETDERGSDDFESALADFQRRFAGSAYSDQLCFSDRRRLIQLLLRYAEAPEDASGSGRRSDRTEAFLAAAPPERRDVAAEVLELGRTSYRLRDDDNIHLAQLKGLVLKAVDEGRRRIASRHNTDAGRLETADVLAALRDPNQVPEPSPTATGIPAEPGFRPRARQLVGQPAGPGVAVGPVRVVRDADDLFALQRGEVLVCDSVDPNMTFIVPLTRAIIERRGGMLIHGAIIAREYGIPCVTGVAGATEVLATGDTVTVDGHLGIVTVATPATPT